MVVSATNTTYHFRRAVSVAILLFVFVLPLHFHGPSVAHVANDCPCVHGTGTQLIPPAGSSAGAPSPLITDLAVQGIVRWTGDWSSLKKVRDPPITLSA
jgi:hypothetical protein